MKIVIESLTQFNDNKLPIQYIVIDCDTMELSKFGDLLLKPVIEFDSIIRDMNNVTDEVRVEYTAANECLTLDWLGKTIVIDVSMINDAGLMVKIHSMKSYEERQRQKK